MGILPEYRQVAEALVTYRSRARALQRVVDLCRKEECLNQAYAQLRYSHTYLLIQYNTPLRQTRYPGVDCGLGSDPKPEEPAAFLPLASEEERSDLAAKCRSELEGLRTADSILSQTLQDLEPKEARHLLPFIRSEGLSSEALKVTISRFTEKKNESDARFYRASGHFVALKQRSEAVVKAEVTEDVIWADTGTWPSELSLFYYRKDYWMFHQRNCHEVRAVMDHEAEISREWTEKIERLEEMMKCEMESEKRLRQVMKLSHSDSYLGADEYESASDDGCGGSREGSGTSESALEGGNGVTDEDVSDSGIAVDDEDLQDLLSLTDVSLPVPNGALVHY